jgi:hypothetical protein
MHNGLVPSRVESIADLAESDQAVHRQQIGDYPTGGELANHDTIAVDPLAVVGELGLQAL